MLPHWSALGLLAQKEQSLLSAMNGSVSAFAAAAAKSDCGAADGPQLFGGAPSRKRRETLGMPALPVRRRACVWRIHIAAPSDAVRPSSRRDAGGTLRRSAKAHNNCLLRGLVIRYSRTLVSKNSYIDLSY